MKNLLRSKRKELGLNIEQMAKKLGVGNTIVGYYETNKKYPRAENIWRLKEAYQLSDQELLEFLKFIHENKNKE